MRILPDEFRCFCCILRNVQLRIISMNRQGFLTARFGIDVYFQILWRRSVNKRQNISEIVGIQKYLTVLNRIVVIERIAIRNPSRVELCKIWFCGVSRENKM